MFKTKLSSEKLTNYLMNIFMILASACVLCLFGALFRLIFPDIKINEWDLLAFVGSMIAAFITIMAIRVPIRAQRNEQRRVQYQTILKQLHIAQQKSRTILSVDKSPKINLEINSYVKRNEMKTRAQFIRDYFEDVTELSNELISLMDWEVFEELDRRFRSFDKFLKYYNELIDNTYMDSERIKVLYDEIDYYLSEAQSFELYLVEYYESILNNYKKITTRPKYSLFE